MKKIYVMLTRTDTVPAKMIRKFACGEFSHVSVSLYPRTDHFYSFARRHINNPLFAGFISENIHTKVFARYPYALCAVYEFEVSDQSYERAKKLLSYFRAHRREATYNFMGAIASKMGITIRRKYKFTCSQFVAFVLYYSKAVKKLPKDPYLMLPNDFTKIEEARLIYKGRLDECVISKDTKGTENNL